KRSCVAIVSVLLLRAGSALEDRRDALAARGADGDQAAAGALLLEELREGRHEASARGREGMPRRERAAVDVELRAVDRAERRVKAEALLAEGRVLPRLEGREDLGGEGLVDLVEVEVRERESGAGQHAGHGVR